MGKYVRWQDRADDKKAAAERGICRELIRNLIEAGYSVGVHDGEEWAQKPTLTKSKLFDALATTDSDTLRVFTFDPETRRIIEEVGYVWLVWGNEPCELIADYTTNLDDVIAPALAKERATESRTF